MDWQSSLKRLYATWSLRFHSSVKQILAFALVGSFALSASAAGQVCADLFSTASQFGTWVPREGGPSMDQHNFLSLGKLGNLYDLVEDPHTGKIVAQKNQKFVTQSRRFMKRRLENLPAEPSPAFVERMREIFAVRELSDDLILMRFNEDTLAFLDIFVKGERTKGLLINRFQRTYETLVSFVYRKAGLEENTVSASVNMHLEAKHLRSTLHSLDYNLVFDKKVWTELLRILEQDVQVADTTAWNTSANQKATSRIIDVEEPLYPMAGVALLSNRKNPQTPLEIKRYFQNDFEDPLGLLGVTSKNEYRARHQMLYEVFKALPAGQVLEIHAHSIVHARAYIKLGFKKVDTIVNPAYPDVQVHLLRATREETMEKIGALLNE